MSQARKRLRAKLVKRQGGLCAYCCEPLTLNAGPHLSTIDEIVPLSLGGLAEPENQVAACHQCNRMKGCMTVPQIRALADAVERMMIERGLSI